MAAPRTPTRVLSLNPCERRRKLSFLVSRGEGKKKSTSFATVPRLGSPVPHPPRLIPCSACRAALGPPTFTLFGKVGSRSGLPPVHFCGRNSHHSTAGHTECMAATPLRPRHRCEAHTNPHHSWRQRKPCVKISHPLVDGADTTRLVEKPFLGNGARMQASGGPCRAPRTSEPSSSARSSAEARGCAA